MPASPSASTEQLSITDWLQLSPQLLSGQPHAPAAPVPDSDATVAPITATTVLAARTSPHIATILPVSRAYASPENAGLTAALAELAAFVMPQL